MTKLGRWAAVGVLCLPIVAAAEERQAALAPQRAEIIAAARELIRGARFCSFITIGEGGQPFARIVEPLPVDDELTVWVGTNPRTRKVGHIRKDPRVTMLCFDPQAMGYVTLIGKARLIADADEKAKHWNEGWSGFYPDGPRSDGYLLIRVAPIRLEILSPSQGIVGDPKTWLPVILELNANP